MLRLREPFLDATGDQAIVVETEGDVTSAARGDYWCENLYRDNGIWFVLDRFRLLKKSFSDTEINKILCIIFFYFCVIF